MQEYIQYITSPAPHPAASASRLDYLLDFNLSQHAVRGLRFTRHVRGMAAITAMTKQLLADDPARTLIGWGDRGQAGAGLVRKQRGPSAKVERALSRVCTVISIDEFRTSAVCAEPGCCGRLKGLPFVSSDGRHSSMYQVRLCPNKACNAHVHRDVNAARNMLAILLAQARGKRRPLKLTRGCEPWPDVVYQALGMGVPDYVDTYDSDCEICG